MNCPECRADSLQPKATTTGVELDECSSCRSIWFDRGEVLFFVKSMRVFDRRLQDALVAATPTELVSPTSGEPMVKASLPSGGSVHQDRQTGGVWLSGSSVQALKAAGELDIRWHDGSQGEPLRFRMPNLLSRTVFTLTGLYALLSFVLITISLAGGLSPGWAFGIAAGIVLVQFLIGPFIMDLFLRFAYKARWEPFDQLPPALQRFVKKTCDDHNMKIPRFAIIEDLSPNAFTYGHHPNNARLALTEGTLELLEEDELNAVVGHEMGHARNWDMALMTLAQLVPMVLYYIYRTALYVNTDDGRARAASTGVAIGAYVLFIISEYIVLWFSRTREYYADRFGAKAAGSPAAMGRALVKIAYGLAGRGQKDAKGGGQRAGAVGAMGIFDSSAAQTLAVSTQGGADEKIEVRAVGGKPPRYTIDGEDLKGAMKWDLWNPWATWFELHSTHPLVAKRLLHLSELSIEMGEEPLVRFDLPKPESYWDEFLFDVGVKIAPTLVLILAALVFFGGSSTGAAGLVVLGGLTMMAKLRFRYPTASYPDMSVATLLRQVKVSDIRPVPCRLEGIVRGKGVPGLIWSDDFVMQDDTGIMFLDHRQPLALWEMIWGWMRGDKLIGGHVTVEGWYRRAPVPFVEIGRFTVDGTTRTSWVRHFRWFTAFLVTAAGVALLVL